MRFSDTGVQLGRTSRLMDGTQLFITMKEEGIPATCTEWIVEEETLPSKL